MIDLDYAASTGADNIEMLIIEAYVEDKPPFPGPGNSTQEQCVQRGIYSIKEASRPAQKSRLPTPLGA